MTETATKPKVDDRAKGETRGVDGATLSLKGPIRDATTIVYTEQQIEDFCKKVETLCIGYRDEGKLLLEAVQIIRQLQEKARPAGHHDVEGFYE